MAACIMHRLAMKLGTLWCRLRAAGRQGSVIALPIVELMIDMPVEMRRAVEPGSRPDKYTAREPLRAIVAIRSAVIRRNLVVSIGANWRHSDAHRNLCVRLMCGSHQQDAG